MLVGQSAKCRKGSTRHFVRIHLHYGLVFCRSSNCSELAYSRWIQSHCIGVAWRRRIHHHVDCMTLQTLQQVEALQVSRTVGGRVLAIETKLKTKSVEVFLYTLSASCKLCNSHYVWSGAIRRSNNYQNIIIEIVITLKLNSWPIQQQVCSETKLLIENKRI